MTAQPKKYITEQEYLAFERVHIKKHEYFDGEIFAMTGGTITHNLLAGNTFASLHRQLRGKGCRVLNSDMRIKVTTTGLNTYPDITVVCGQILFLDERRDTITNPAVIIEVLSPSTERYDRGMKFQNYRTIASLCDYVLIAQDKQHIEHYIRQENGQWLFEEATTLQGTIALTAVDGVLSLADIYDGVDIEPEKAKITRDIPVDD